MNSRLYISSALSFAMYLVAQVLIMKNFVLFDSAFCFIYIGFILMLPLEAGAIFMLIAAFFLGLGVDIFYDSLGVNAASTVFLAFLRPYWLRVLTPRGGYEDVVAPNINSMDFGWFLAYALPLIFIHQFTLFFLEAGSFRLFVFTLVKVLASTALTFFVFLLAQYLFYRKTV